MLDAEGEKLALGIAARPYMLKPNRYELELLCGRELQIDSIEVDLPDDEEGDSHED